MKKNLFALLTVLVLTSLVLSACGTCRDACSGDPSARTNSSSGRSTDSSAAAAGAKTVKKIAFFVSDLSQRVPSGPGYRGEGICQGKVRR